MRLMLGMVLTVLMGAASAAADLKTESIEYLHEGTVLEGYLAYEDGAMPRSLPGVLIAHEWRGFGDYVKGRAEQIARLGYAAFAIDMYGKGVYAKDHQEAAALSGAFRQDRAKMRKRAHAGLEVLTSQGVVDPGRLAAIGYCFGGTTVLEMARAGEPLGGVVTFHGGLATPQPEDAANITARVLVLHGAEDPHISQEELAEFQEQMDAAGADYRVIQYPGAVHSFTVKDAGGDPSTGTAYNAEADQESWNAMESFLAAVLHVRSE